MALEKARIVDVSVDPEVAIDVLFNPTGLDVEHRTGYAELTVPGLATPILQFIRGDGQVLALELFLDRTNRRETVEADLERLRRFVRIDGKLHAPPVCRFDWGALRFQGVITSLKERFTLFAEDGRVLRARLTVQIRSYRSAEVQRRELKLESPDRTRVHVFKAGETLAGLADRAYGDPRLWTVIARANDVDRPRFVAPGTPLRIPAL